MTSNGFQNNGLLIAFAYGPGKQVESRVWPLTANGNKRRMVAGIEALDGAE